MSTLNGVRSRLGGVLSMLSPYSSTLTLLVYILVSLTVLYWVYGIVYPGSDKFEQVIINKSFPASDLQGMQTKLYPPMTTGGEYSFQTWLFLSNVDANSGNPKHIFTIASDGPPGADPPHVTMLGALDGNSNKLILRVHQDKAGINMSGGGPDFTLNTNITNLFSGSLKSNTGMGPGGLPICDIGELDLQRWICLTVVVNGRLVEVYLDGKMARSCVCPGIPTVVPGNNYLTMGLQRGWGGAVSTTRFYGYALTPARVYEMYQQGPAPIPGAKVGFLMSLLSMVGLSLDTTPALSKPPVLATK